MEITKSKCSMFGCDEHSYRGLGIAPGTVVELCLQHFIAEGGVADEKDVNVAAGSASQTL